MAITRFIWILATGGLVLSVQAASAQDFPNKPIRIIVAGNPGGGGDFAMRLIAPKLTASFGQPVIVDNRPSGPIPGETTAKAAPDGYTLLSIGNSLWLGPLLGEHYSFDGLRDFSPIMINSQQPLLVVVTASLPAKNVKELVALAKARPGELNYASLGIGTATHLAAELFKSMAHVNMVRIGYGGAGSALTDLMSGQVQVMFQNASAVMAQVKAGKLRALAVATDRPSELTPGLPTVSASGVPGYEASSVLAIFAPAKTPDPIIKRVNQDFARALIQPDVKQKFFESGAEPVASSPEELTARMKSDLAKWGKLIKETGIKAE